MMRPRCGPLRRRVASDPAVDRHRRIGARRRPSAHEARASAGQLALRPRIDGAFEMATPASAGRHPWDTNQGPFSLTANGRVQANTADQLRSALKMKIAHLGLLPASVRFVSCIRLFGGATDDVDA